MSQIFHRSTNSVARVSIFGALFMLAGLLWFLMQFNRSSYVTQAGVPKDQMVPFSHQHHVGGLGLDCRYCHTSVEDSAFAGIPPTQTCMTCHSQIWKGASMLAPVRASYRQNRALRWIRVHDLPDFVYFNHSIHIHQGIGCVTCHGRVDRMPLMWKTRSLQMEWCLECHRNPERYVRPREEVFNLAWEPSESQETLGPRLVRQYHIATRTDCSTCHR